MIGWNLGIKESVAGVVVIGFSVDYTIHLGHMFDVARSQGLTTRQEKFDYSIRKMGETVLAGAITTAGSTVFLLACQLTFFTAMGTLIILTVAYSLGYSLLFFMPLLRVMGPEGRVDPPGSVGGIVDGRDGVIRLRPIGATLARQIPVLKVTRSNRVSVTGYPNHVAWPTVHPQASFRPLSAEEQRAVLAPHYGL